MRLRHQFHLGEVLARLRKANAFEESPTQYKLSDTNGVNIT